MKWVLMDFSSNTQFTSLNLAPPLCKCVCVCVLVYPCASMWLHATWDISDLSSILSLSFSPPPSLAHTHSLTHVGAALWHPSSWHIYILTHIHTTPSPSLDHFFWCGETLHFAFMEDYHKPDQQTVLALRNIANRLRIHCIKATTAAGTGWVAPRTWSQRWNNIEIHTENHCKGRLSNIAMQFSFSFI